MKLEGKVVDGIGWETEWISDQRLQTFCPNL